MNRTYVVIAISSAFAIAGLIWALSSSSDSLAQDGGTTTVISESSSEQIFVTNNIRHLVPLNDIKSGGPPKDGIPSIDNPKFAKTQDAKSIADDDLVIGLRIGGETRAYPLSILVWHEIVNDTVGGVPVAVTYCPLCFTSQVFERTIDGKETEFGTSGKLYNSNLVMYDRNTDSLWSQGWGKAIVGDLTGYELERIPFDVARWSDWKTLYPDTLVLTTDTGFLRAYGSDPYGGYYTDSRILFPVKNSDDRMHPKEIVLGFDNKDYFKAYKLSDVESQKIINDDIGDKKLVLISAAPYAVRAFESTVEGQTLEFAYDGQKIVDTQTGTQWDFDGNAISGSLKGKQLTQIPYDPSFWFSWVAFYPTTEVY